ncbi:MAG: signal peptidase I [Candidatus Dormiibacterota bacterium]
MISVADRPQNVKPSLAHGWRLRFPKLLAAIPMVAILFAVWVALAPPVLGGSTSYVITDGISMLPRYHAGDLVLLREQSSYHVGEVAGYHNLQLGVTVMHRIIAIKSGHYYFKGDNNNFIDTYHPTASKIVGAEWVHLPGWGNFILMLRAPFVTAVLLGLMWLFLFAPRLSVGSRRRRSNHA